MCFLLRRPLKRLLNIKVALICVAYLFKRNTLARGFVQYITTAWQLVVQDDPMAVLGELALA